MKKEILIYGGINTWAVEDVIKTMSENADKDIVLRINTPGGDVLATWGLIAKFNEHPKLKTVKVDGRAASIGAFICCYADEVEALDVSTFLFHRAAYYDYIESGPQFTEALRNSLIESNKHLRAAMESKFTAEKWLKVTGVTLDDLFSLNARINVELNATQAKELGLVSKILKITPSIRSSIKAYSETALMAFSATFDISVEGAQNDDFVDTAIASKQNILNNNNNSKGIMTIEKMKADHPELYAQVISVGVAQEKDRIGAFMKFAHLDLEAVKKGIDEGNSLSQTQMADFAVKLFAAAQLTDLEGAAAPPTAVVDPVPPVSAEAQSVTQFKSDLRASLGLS